MTIAMADVPHADAGLGSGITNLSQQVGGALGLAALATIASTHTRTLLSQHSGVQQALIGGYHLAFTVGIAAVLVGIVIALLFLRQAEPVAAITASAAAVDEPPLARSASVEDSAGVVQERASSLMSHTSTHAPASHVRRRIIIPIRPTGRPVRRGDRPETRTAGRASRRDTRPSGS